MAQRSSMSTADRDRNQSIAEQVGPFAVSDSGVLVHASGAA
jgi:hypothetical protein